MSVRNISDIARDIERPAKQISATTSDIRNIKIFPAVILISPWMEVPIGNRLILQKSIDR